MLRSEMQTIAAGLTAYAAECQAGFEHRHSKPGRPPWQRQRCDLISQILRDVAQWSGVNETEMLSVFEQRLEDSGRCFSVELAPAAQQRATVYALRGYMDELARGQGDHRRQLWPVKELLKDMSLHPVWGDRATGAMEARQTAERLLPALTVHQPLRFTRLCLGDTRGLYGADFVSGAVLDEDGVMNTGLFQRITEEYPEVEVWPAQCTVCICGGWGAVRDADEFDLAIMRSEGSDFLQRKGVKVTGEYRELEISAVPTMGMALAM